MLEEWIKWEPIQGLSKKYYIENVSEGEGGFKILLSDVDEQKKNIQIIFENSVDSYIRTDETLRYNTLLKIDEKYGTKFYTDWTFFKVINSRYLRWISEESCTISDNRGYIHFSIIDHLSFLDIICGYEPKVEFVE